MKLGNCTQTSNAGRRDEVVVAALAHDGPVLIDAVVSRMVLPIPPAITTEMAKGFSLYMVKAIFNGRADDLVPRIVRPRNMV